MRKACLLLAVAPALALACGAFGSDGGGGTGPVDDGGGSPDAVAAVDAPTEDASTIDAGTECTPSKGPLCAPTSCPRKTLYRSSGAYPFAVVTDANNVYWIEQRGANAYDGSGIASVLRVDRVGANDASRAATLATNQPLVVAIALAGGYVYFTTYETPDAGSPGSHLKRVAAGCNGAACTVEELGVGTAWDGIRIVRLHAAGANVLFALAESGHFYRIPLAGGALPQLLVNAGAYPGSILTDRAAYVSGQARGIDTHSLDGVTAVAGRFTVPAATGAGSWIARLATDCSRIYGLRPRTDGTGDMLVAASLDSPPGTAVAQLTAGLGVGLYDITADERWIYGAGINAGGGLFAIDPTDGTAHNLSPGNVWKVTVDDLGVYWGEHGGTGELYMLDKKPQ